MREQHVSPDDNWNYVHYLMYAIANLMEEGKFQKASALSGKLGAARGKLESSLYAGTVRDSISRINARLPVALRIADWPEVIHLLNEANASVSRPHLKFLAHALRDYAIGTQALQTRNLADAERAESHLRGKLDRETAQMQDPLTKVKFSQLKSELLKSQRIQVNPDALLGPMLKQLSIMLSELQASLLTAHNKPYEAQIVFQKAEAEEAALNYHEPPSYIRPVAETEGAALMSVRNWSKAREAYQRAMLNRPGSGLAIYGLALCSEMSGNTGVATGQYRAFLKAWTTADQTLPQIRHAREYLKQHPV